jgi:shikimate dehydrogenase
VTERPFPPLVPQDGRLSTEQYQGQGWQNKHLFYGHPPGERPYVELIGDPIEHELLLDVLRFWIEQKGMTVDLRMRRVAVADAHDYVERSRADPKWRGAFVTGELRTAIKPHVSLVARDVDQLPFVDAIFRFELGWPVGVITAAGGFWKSLEVLFKEQQFPIWFAGIQIVGSGPDAFAVAGVLVERKIDNLWFYTDDLEEGGELARRLGLGEERVLPLNALGPLPAAAQTPFGAQIGTPHFLINTTLMGMEGAGEVPVELDLYPDQTLVYDLVYEPRETGRLRQARERGLQAVNGLQLLVEQAGQAFWLFVLDNPPRKQDADLMASLG